MTALVLVTATALAGPIAVALAVKPTKNAVYAGTIEQGKNILPISFKTSKSGKSVGGFHLRVPVYCHGAGFPTVGKGKPAKISSKGTFKAKVPLVKAKKPFGTVTVTGKFGKGGTAKGDVTTTIKGHASCNGKSPYTAHG